MSNKPVLYYAIRSPPCRAALLAAAEIGVELDLRPMNLMNGDHMTPEFLKINPQHTIPTLDDNGVIITDSHVICSYLADKYSKNDNLYPKDLAKRSAVQTCLHFDSGHVFARIRFLYEPIIYQGSKDFSEFKTNYIAKTFDVMENYLKDSPYVCGEHLTIADLCLLASYSSITKTVPIDAVKYPKLTNWLNKLSKLPYYQTANQEGAELLQQFIKDKLAA